MGGPDAYIAGSGANAVRQDTVSALINNVDDNLQELHNHLTHIQAMISGPRPEDGSVKIPPSQPGQLGRLMDLRTKTQLLIQLAANISANV